MNNNHNLKIVIGLWLVVGIFLIASPVKAQTALPQCADVAEEVHYTRTCTASGPVPGAINCSGVTPDDWCCPGTSQMTSQGCVSDTNVTTPENTLTSETLDSLNPLKLYSTGVEEDLSKPAGIINRVLRFAFPIAGLILFLMLVWAGFEILAGATEKKSLDAGKQRATAAVVGFILLFVSYWLTQIIEVIFGVTIL